jgi:subtilisin family serine protease
MVGGYQFEPGEVIAIGAGAAGLARATARGFRIIETRHLATLGIAVTRLAVPAGLSTVAAVGRLQLLIPRAAVTLNHLYSVYAAAGAPCPSGQCGLGHLIGWTGVPADCGRGLRLGMIDTRVWTGHPALAGQRIAARSFSDGKAPSGGAHGTAVAALLVGDEASGFAGLMPGAELFAADVFYSARGGGDRANAFGLAAGLDWLAASGVLVVNVSLTGPPNVLLEVAVEELAGRGIAVVAAAGNDGPAARPVYPAAYPPVIAVTAVDHRFRVYRRANRGTYVSFAAPGVGVWSADGAGGGRLFQGTSMAVPFATAAVADLVARTGQAGAAELRASLAAAAIDLGAPGKDPVFGWGLIQARPACRY